MLYGFCAAIVQTGTLRVGICNMDVCPVLEKRDSFVRVPCYVPAWHSFVLYSGAGANALGGQNQKHQLVCGGL